MAIEKIPFGFAVCHYYECCFFITKMLLPSTHISERQMTDSRKSGILYIYMFLYSTTTLMAINQTSVVL